MRGAEHHHRHARCRAAAAPRGADADRGMRIDQSAGLAPDRARSRARVSVSPARTASNSSRIARERRGSAARSCRDCASEPISRAHGRGIAAIGVEQQPLEIRGHLDVHRRRLSSASTSRSLIAPGLQRAGENVVDIGGDDEPLDRQAHLLGHPAGKNVAEIAGRHGEGDFAVRRAERHGAREIIDHLRHDARPIDRIDAGKRKLVAECVVG